ncbi:MAG: hypothetical protein Q4F65_14230 [Propionibacteriaceae bacterium]|nr:hypothetical protein [Propionibacteriaceae bacterium]
MIPRRGTTFFDDLALDRRRIHLDCDVTVAPGDDRRVLDLMTRGGIDAGLAVGATTGERWERADRIDLSGADADLVAEQAAAHGVRALRVAALAARPGLARRLAQRFVLLVEDDLVDVLSTVRGIGARVVLLDHGYYRIDEFLAAARSEPGLVVSTRRWLGPESIETVCGEVGAHHLAFGSGIPLQDLEVSAWRLRDARVSDAEYERIAGGTLTNLLDAVPR